MEQTQDRQKSVRPKYNLWQNSAWMITLAWKREKSVLWLCLLLAALTVGNNLIGLFLAPTVLGMVAQAVPLGRLCGTILGFCAALMAVGAATSYLQNNTLFGRVKVRVGIVAALHEKFAKTSYPNTEDAALQKTLDKARMAVSGNSQATEAIWNTLTKLLQNSIGFIVYIALLSALDPLLVLVTLATALCGFFASRRINEWGYRHREEEATYSQRVHYISTKSEDETLAKDVRIFGMGNWLIDVYDSAMELYRCFVVRGEKVYIWANVIDLSLAFLRNGIAYAYLIAQTLNGSMSAAQFLLYFTAVSGFTMWVSGVLTDFSMLHKQSLDLSIVREFLETPEPFRFEDGAALQPNLRQPYQIDLRDVAFRYPGADRDTLRHMNLTIRPGEKLAVVGLNGAGKTTLIKLICGFYDPTEGAVLLNGRDIREFNRRDYYRHFSAVFQQFSLLAVSMAENIAQSHEAINEARVDACLEQAGLLDKINGLPNGIRTALGKEVYEDGTSLSGGETQRLMLARALYKDAPFLVLDEPTAALDPLAESDIYTRYNELTTGRTAVYISHRLASTRFCDRILFLADGGIAEEGTHASLLKLGGRYAELFEIQSRYYREGDANYEEA